MTTKEQERKALEQIRKIVEGLGEDSYIGMAFEGCFEDAEENIENDWGCSMNGRWQDAEQKIEHLKAEMEELKNERDALKMINSKNNAELGLAKETIQQEANRANEWCEVYNRAVEQTYKDEARIEALELENMKLKAKLYDLMVAEK